MPATSGFYPDCWSASARHFSRKVASTGAKTARNAAALHAEMTPGAGALATAAVAITGPFSDARKGPN